MSDESITFQDMKDHFSGKRIREDETTMAKVRDAFYAELTKGIDSDDGIPADEFMEDLRLKLGLPEPLPDARSEEEIERDRQEILADAHVQKLQQVYYMTRWVNRHKEHIHNLSEDYITGLQSGERLTIEELDQLDKLIGKLKSSVERLEFYAADHRKSYVGYVIEGRTGML